MRNIMICGASGSMASYLLESLTKVNNVESDLRVFMVGRDLEKLVKSANILTIASSLVGNGHQFIPLVIDIEQDPIALTAAISEINPEIVVNATRAVSGVKYGPMSIKMGVGYGVWLPFSLRLSYLIAKAVEASGTHAMLINSSYSDAVCPALAEMADARTPTIGIGNVFHLVPRIQMAVASLVNSHFKMEKKHSDFEVFLTSGHFSNTYISREGDARGSETLLEVYSTEGGITQETLSFYGFSKEDVYAKCKDIKVAEGSQRNIMAASSTFRCIMELLQPSGRLFHAPGVHGLVGGYPVYAEENSLTGDVILNIHSPSYTLNQMIKCNEQNLRCDGIDSIKEGKVTWTADAIESMAIHLGFCHKSMNLDFDTIVAYGDELKAKLIENGMM